METKTDYEFTIDLRQIARVIWRNMLLIIATMLVCGVIGYCISAYLIAPTYSASADMLVNNNQDASATTITNSDLTASSSLVDTYAVILKSHNILEQIIRDLHLDYDYQTLAGKVSVSAVNNTQVMRIKVKDQDPQTALAIVSKIVELAPDVIMDTVNAGSVKTVDDPYTNGKPVSPSKRNYTAIASLLGLLACLAVLILAELLNDRFRSEEDVRNILGLPVLGVIPVEDKSGGRGKKTQKGGRR